MHPLPTVSDIEAAARSAGLSIAALCRRADVTEGTFYRWKRGSGAPNMRIVQRFMDEIEAARSAARAAADVIAARDDETPAAEAGS